MEEVYKLRLKCLWNTQGQTDSESWINGSEAQERLGLAADVGNNVHVLG